MEAPLVLVTGTQHLEAVLIEAIERNCLTIVVEYVGIGAICVTLRKKGRARCSQNTYAVAFESRNKK